MGFWKPFFGTWESISGMFYNAVIESYCSYFSYGRRSSTVQLIARYIVIWLGLWRRRRRKLNEMISEDGDVNDAEDEDDGYVDEKKFDRIQKNLLHE